MTYYFYTSSTPPRLISSQEEGSSLFSNLFSAIFDQIFEQDRFQEALQNSLQTYQEELFKKKDEYQLSIPSKILQSTDISSLSEPHCFICLDTFLPNDSVYTLSCSHTFHMSCLNDSISFQHNSCPLCREPLQLSPKWEEFQNENGHFIRFQLS